MAHSFLKANVSSYLQYVPSNLRKTILVSHLPSQFDELFVDGILPIMPLLNKNGYHHIYTGFPGRKMALKSIVFTTRPESLDQVFMADVVLFNCRYDYFKQINL